MTPEQEKKIDCIQADVTEMKNTINGRGGLFDRVENLEKEAETNKTFRARTLMLISLAGGAVAMLGERLLSWLGGGK